ncbi:MAG: 50S ribosomal protein L15 [Bacillales bacterium]|jgi:large subunit ribosomal protein L15|nr:50S ribosomal protein L15 [Bacillales bacterium]
MKLNELKFAEGSREKAWRVGRGTGSGNGKTSGKGHKGQNARSGGGVRPGFEGGQTPIFRRLSKRGFHNVFKVTYSIVNISDLEARFEDGAEICPHCLKEAGLVRQVLNGGVKLLGKGTLSKKFTVSVHKASKSAISAIESAGGKVELLTEVAVPENTEGA